MTKDDFLSLSVWKKDTLLQSNLFSSFLEHDITVSIGFNQFNDDRKISDFAIRSLNDFLLLDKSNLGWIKSELWKACDITFQNASYGLTGVPRKEGQSEYDANKDFFSIHNMEDAFNKSRGTHLFIDNNNSGQSESCFWLEYETIWDAEHNTIFVFRNGEQYSVE